MAFWPLAKLLINLGILAKESIGNEFAETIDMYNAIDSGKPYIHVKGGYLLLPERELCDMKTNKEDGHLILVNKKGVKRYDITWHQLRKRELEARQEYAEKGCVFYPAYTLNPKSKTVWKSDDIKGYFRRIGKDAHRFMPSDEFVKGEIKNIYGWVVEGTSKYSAGVRYTPQGELLTPETVIEKRNAESKKRSIEKGNKFYYTYRLNEREDVEPFCLKDVDTDEVVYHDYALDYYTAGKIREIEVEIRKPHHEEVDRVEYRYVVEEMKKKPRYNLDGTKWVE